MLRTIEAIVEKDGLIRPLEEIDVRAGARALVTILSDEIPVTETALQSEIALATDWDRDEEDEAWAHLQA